MSLLHPAGDGDRQQSRRRNYASWFKALADPTRIRILNLLAQSEPVCVCDITDHFPWASRRSPII